MNRDGRTAFDEWIRFPFGLNHKGKTFGYGFWTNGNYDWSVREWGPCGGLSEWSNAHALTINVPPCTSPPPEVAWVDLVTDFDPLRHLDPPLGDSSLRPTFCFAVDNQTSWNRVQVFRDGKLFQTAWIATDDGNCWTSDVDLPAGDYAFVVTPYSACGLGDPSDPEQVTLSCRAADTLSGLTNMPCSDGNLSCAWEAEPGMSVYQVVVSRDGATVYNEWLDIDRDKSILDAPSEEGMVYATLPVPCVHGDYEISVRGWNEACGATKWAGPLEIVFDCTLTRPALLKPSDDVTMPRPTCEWVPVEGAERYALWLGRNGSRYHAETLDFDPPDCGTESSDANSFSEVGTAMGWRSDDFLWTYDLPFSFPFCGKTYDQCFVGSNGTITFGTSAFPSLTGTEAELADRTMIAVMWDDLHTDLDAGDDIYVESSGSEVTIRWQGGYCCHTNNGDINISATLYADGRIRMSYGDGNPRTGNLIGISAGNGTDYIVSPRSNSSQTMGNDIVFTPDNPRWSPFWNMPLGNYTWYVRPESDCAGRGPWSAAGTFNIVSP